MDNQINPYDSKTVPEVLFEFKVKPESGLTDGDVKERQKREGFNEVPEEKQSMLVLFLSHFGGLPL